MFNNKIVNLLLVGIGLFFVYRFATKKNTKKESKNTKVQEDFYIKYDNFNNNGIKLKPILKKNKGFKHNKRVRFSLPEPFQINENEENLIKQNIDQYHEHMTELDNNTTELCQNKNVDLNESFVERLDKVRNCDKIQNNNVSLRDIYDDIVIDYKKSEPLKQIVPVINSRKDAAFGLTSYNNSHWNYENENVINGGNIDDNLYANDPHSDSIARF